METEIYSCLSSIFQCLNNSRTDNTYSVNFSYKMFKQVRGQNNDKPILKYILFIIMLFIKNEFLS